MENLFIQLFNMSIAASWLVLAIAILRLILKHVPKSLICVLWIFVAIRLICPIALESNFSIIPSVNTIPKEIVSAEKPEINSGIPMLNSMVNPIISGQDVSEEIKIDSNASAEVLEDNGENKEIEDANKDNLINSNITDNRNETAKTDINVVGKIVSVVSNIWIIGVAVMVLYAVISYIRIYKKICEAVEYKGNIWLCDRVASPFILGFIRPRIILPSNMKEKEMEYVIAHEQAHLKRGDYFWKPLGFVLLAIYWFNPIMWIAYILLCKDIELACDEMVIKNMDVIDKKAYTTTLLDYSISTRMITACPLAFGENSVKSRIKSVLNYKKPAFWVVVVSVVICMAVGVMFLTNPKSKEFQIDKDLEQFMKSVIWEHYDAARYDENYYGMESHRIIDVVENGDKITIYAWVLYAEYGHYRGDIEEVTSEYNPTVITVKKDKDGYMGYELVEYWVPRTGSYYEADIKEKFPSNIQDKALDSKAYIKEQKEEIYAAADKHFKDEAWSKDKTTFTTESGYVLNVDEYEKLNWFWKEGDIYSMSKEMLESELRKTNFDRKELINTYFIKSGIEFSEKVEYYHFDYEVNKGCDVHKVIAVMEMEEDEYSRIKGMVVNSSLEKSSAESCKNAISEYDIGWYGELEQFEIYGGEYESEIQVTDDVTKTGPAARFIMLCDDSREVYVYFYDSVLETTPILDSDDELYNGESYDKEYYEYPDTTGMNGNEIIAACRIKEVTLDRMSTEQLAQAVIDYPMLMIHYASSQSKGTDLLQGACDAYAELLTRDDAEEVLFAKILQYEYDTGTEYSSKLRLLKDIVLAEPNFSLNEYEVSYLESDEINYEAFSYEMAMVGYTESSEFTDDALNAPYIGMSSSLNYPIQRFDTEEELKSFKSEYSDIFELEKSYGTNYKSFNEIAQKYNSTYFEENTLFIVYVATPQMSDRYVERVYNNGKSLCVYIGWDREKDADDVMSGYLLMVEMTKESVKNCKIFNAK